jgi:Zn2+/Cd2+-exporting ATPase
MKHRHTYDKNGKQTCCTQEEKINVTADKQFKKEQTEVGC